MHALAAYLVAFACIFAVNLLPAFGRYKLDEITLRDIEGYKARKLATGLSPKSLNNHLTMLRWAHHEIARGRVPLVA